MLCHDDGVPGTLVSFHAHPDDETILTGGTIARAADDGHRVVLVFATRGDNGEVADGVLAPSEALADRRQAEARRAAEILGAARVEFLGYRDSGMADTDTNNASGSFWSADVDDAARRLAVILEEEDADVLTTYDERGGYGHPDHIQAHRVAMYASQLAAAPGFRPDLGPTWQISKVYWTTLPRSYVKLGIEALIASGNSGFFGVDNADDIPFLTPDEIVTTHVEGLEHEPAKMAALRAHASQVDEEHGFFQMAKLLGPTAMGNEFFMLVKGELGPNRDADGRERDLFSGLG
jgi:N-acetyl-1-D-myo-inositol-2-amino-2-deoxy-alpha-D-glucopyranoside deacetylase